MPLLFIDSLVRRQHEKRCQRLDRVRQEIDRFLASVESQVGTEVADAFRAHLDLPWGVRYRGERLPEVPPEAMPFLDGFLWLDRREAAIRRKAFHSAFCCWEPYQPPNVLSCCGETWMPVELWYMQDECLSVANVRRLLEVVRDSEMVLPTQEDVASWGQRDDGEPRTCEEWRQVLARRRRRLVRFLELASKLDEDVRCLF